MAISLRRNLTLSKRLSKSNCNFLEFDPLQLQLQLHFFNSNGITGRCLKM